MSKGAQAHGMAKVAPLNVESEETSASSEELLSPAATEEGSGVVRDAKTCPYAALVASTGPQLAQCPAMAEQPWPSSWPGLFKECRNEDDVSAVLSSLPQKHSSAGAGALGYLDSLTRGVREAMQSLSGRDAAAMAKHRCPAFPSWAPADADANADADAKAPVDVAKLLKEETRKVHQEAERVAFVRAFIRGKVERGPYRSLLARLYHVYVALEAALDEAAAASPAVSSVWFPGKLARVAALEEDLRFFYGADWRSHDEVREPTPAAAVYVRRLREVAAEDPLLLVAHAYTRYMGDLSGGQTLKRVARKALRLQGDEGTAFYEFENMEESAKDFKNMYRQRLAGLGVDEGRAQALAREAVASFRLNIGIFLEMNALCGLQQPVVSGDDDDEGAAKEQSLGKQKPKTGAGTCPFAKLSAASDAADALAATAWTPQRLVLVVLLLVAAFAATNHHLHLLPL